MFPFPLLSIMIIRSSLALHSHRTIQPLGPFPPCFTSSVLLVDHLVHSSESSRTTPTLPFPLPPTLYFPSFLFRTYVPTYSVYVIPPLRHTLLLPCRTHFFFPVCITRKSGPILRTPPERYSRDRNQSVLAMLSFGLIPPPQTHARFRLRFERHWQPFALHPVILSFADPPYLPFPSHLPASSLVLSPEPPLPDLLPPSNSHLTDLSVYTAFAHAN
ncbi:hypothetical protein EDB83DRAFT_2374958 [Lactarius deliciosus]|nr:hypothetical protein EDB83DRAFT_2374958 [Lactarius deliciosus]